jgi:hypothetical protein
VKGEVVEAMVLRSKDAPLVIRFSHFGVRNYDESTVLQSLISSQAKRLHSLNLYHVGPELVDSLCEGMPP